MQTYFLTDNFRDSLLLLPQSALKVEQLPDDGLELAVLKDPEHPHLALLLFHFGGASGHQLARAATLEPQLLPRRGQPLALLPQLPFQFFDTALHLREEKKEKGKR